MTTEAKFLIGAALTTIILTVGGVFLLSGKSKQAEKASTLGTKIENSILLENSRYQLGNPNASVKIVEFGDFQCPPCAQADPIVKDALEKNKDKVYFVFRNYPLPSHNNSRDAAQAAEAAGLQDKYWDMHYMIYENQKEWSDSSGAKEIFESYAQKLGLDVAKYKEDFDKTRSVIEQDYADGNQVGVDSTPTFFINGQKHAGVIDASQFQALIDQASTSK